MTSRKLSLLNSDFLFVVAVRREATIAFETKSNKVPQKAGKGKRNKTRDRLLVFIFSLNDRNDIQTQSCNFFCPFWLKTWKFKTWKSVYLSLRLWDDCRMRLSFMRLVVLYHAVNSRIHRALGPYRYRILLRRGSTYRNRNVPRPLGQGSG